MRLHFNELMPDWHAGLGVMFSDFFYNLETTLAEFIRHGPHSDNYMKIRAHKNTETEKPKISGVNNSIKAFFRITIFLILMATLFGCSSQDPFYNKGSGWDYLRFPLLKPYYAISTTQGEEKWVIPLENELPLKKDSFLLEIKDVRKISVSEKAIMVFTPDKTKIASSNIKERIFHYFILIPDDHLEMGFENEEGFLDYLNMNNLNKPEWLEPLSIL
jgi:hypothetical protein